MLLVNISLRMIYRPGGGEFAAPPSTIEYIYDLSAGPVSSGQIPFGGAEGGWPSTGFDQFLGFGAQINGPDPQLGEVNILFENFSFDVPSPGSLLLLSAGGLVALRRHR